MAKQEQRIIRRTEWGARHGNGFGVRPVGDLKVYVHHSVTVAPDLVAPFDDDYAAVRQLEAIGQSRFGRGISYQFPVTPAGLVFEGVGVDRIGAAITNYNTPTANIVLVGNYDTAKPPRPMLEAVDWLLHHGVARGWWRKPVVAGGHRDAPGASTACPGRHAYALLGDLNAGKYHSGGPVFVDNPVTPPSSPSVPGKLDVDGRWGSATTRKAQQVLGTPVDGIVSSQSRSWAADNPGLTTGWEWVSPASAVGSRLILKHQEVLRGRGRYKGDMDGLVGPKYIRALQVDLGVPGVDGELWNPSAAVRALQQRLNGGKI